MFSWLYSYLMFQWGYIAQQLLFGAFVAVLILLVLGWYWLSEKRHRRL